MPDFSTIFTSNGVAIGLIIVGCMFFYFKLWPWYVTRQAARDTEETRRHDQYLATLERSNNLTEKFTDALNALSVVSNGTAQVIATLVDRVDEHHTEVMQELRKAK